MSHIQTMTALIGATIYVFAESVFAKSGVSEVGVLADNVLYIKADTGKEYVVSVMNYVEEEDGIPQLLPRR